MVKANTIRVNVNEVLKILFDVLTFVGSKPSLTILFIGMLLPFK